MNFSCPHCGLALNGNACGGVYSCPRCLGQFQVPTPVVEPPVTPAIESGSGMPVIVDRPAGQAVRYVVEPPKKSFWTAGRVIWAIFQPLLLIMAFFFVMQYRLSDLRTKYERDMNFRYIVNTSNRADTADEVLLRFAIEDTPFYALLVTIIVGGIGFYLLGHKKTLVITRR